MADSSNFGFFYLIGSWKSLAPSILLSICWSKTIEFQERTVTTPLIPFAAILSRYCYYMCIFSYTLFWIYFLSPLFSRYLQAVLVFYIQVFYSHAEQEPFVTGDTFEIILHIFISVLGSFFCNRKWCYAQFYFNYG